MCNLVSWVFTAEFHVGFWSTSQLLEESLLPGMAVIHFLYLQLGWQLLPLLTALTVTSFSDGLLGFMRSWGWTDFLFLHRHCHYFPMQLLIRNSCKWNAQETIWPCFKLLGKNRPVGLYQTKNFCTAKQLSTEWKGSLPNQRKYLQTIIWERLNFQNVQETFINQYKNKQATKPITF